MAMTEQEPKPFSIQQPEEIAKLYGGNKQKIAQAASMGIVDPTAAVLAGMFIDRMRAGAMQEQAPTQTVAQQVFAPPAPPMPPQGVMPGQAPPGGLGAPPPMQGPAMAPPPQAPMGMPGMAEGGLAMLGIPDAMFDEPGDGGYASGGLVAFADGGMADSLLGDPMAYQAALMGARPELSEYELREREYMQKLLDPETKAKRRKEDMWSTLAQIGFGMAGSNSPYFAQAVGQSASAALPAMAERVKEQRAEERAAISAMAGSERALRGEGREIVKGSSELEKARRDLEMDKEKLVIEREKIAADLKKAGMDNATSLRYAEIMMSGRGGGAGSGKSPVGATKTQINTAKRAMERAQGKQKVAFDRWKALPAWEKNNPENAATRKYWETQQAALDAVNNYNYLKTGVDLSAEEMRANAAEARGMRKPVSRNRQVIQQKGNQPPAGIDPAIWAVMSPEERVLFK